METTKLYLRPGEKARLELLPKVGIDESSVKWSTQSGIVALDHSEQKTPLDMAIIATGQPGIAYVEVEAQVSRQDRKISHTFEIHNVEGETSEEYDAFARLRRSYRRRHEQVSETKGVSGIAPYADNGNYSEASSGNGDPANENKTDAEQDRSMTRMNSDNKLMKEGAPARPAEAPVQTIEPLPVNDTTTSSLGGTIGSSAFGSGAKPTGTVVGIDTINPNQHVETPLDTPRIEQTPEQKAKESEDREQLDETIRKAAETDERLKEEAKKLPSETELSGEPLDVVIRPTDTVDDNDKRRAANKADSEKVKDSEKAEESEKVENSEKEENSDEDKTSEESSDEKEAEDSKESEDDSPKEESPSEQATPETATKKAAKPTPKAAKKTDKAK